MNKALSMLFVLIFLTAPLASAIGYASPATTDEDRDVPHTRGENGGTEIERKAWCDRARGVPSNR